MGLPGPAARLLEDFSSFQELPVAVQVLTCDGRVLRANSAMTSLLGRSERELLGNDVAALVPHERAPDVARVLENLSSGAADVRECSGWYLRPDGERVPVQVQRSAVRDANGIVALLVEHAVPGAVDDEPARAELAAAVQRSAALFALADRLAAGPHAPQPVAAAAADAAHQLFGGGVSVFFVDPADTATLQAAAVRTGDPGSEAELRRLYAEAPLRTDAGVFGAGCTAGRPTVLREPWGTRAPSPLRGEYAPWLSTNPVRWLMLVPLAWDGRVLGLVAVGRHADRAFTDVDLAYAEQLATQVSKVLGDVQLAALERSTARRGRAVARVTRRCDEALEQPGGMLDAVVRSVADEVGGACCVWLPEHAGRGPSRTAVAHPDPDLQRRLVEWLPSWSERDGQFLPSVLRDGRRFVVGAHALQELAAAANLDVAAQPIGHSAYGVRLEARGELVGVLAVGSTDVPLTADDCRLVDALADRVALALDNAALLSAARASRSRARALVEHCSDLLLLADREGAITYASPAAARTFGRSLGRTLMAFVVPDDRQRVVESWRATLARPGLSAPLDVRVVDTAGRERRLSAVANNLLDDPAVDGVVLTVRDVTEEREASAGLAQRASQHAALAAIGATALTAPLDELCRLIAKTIGETLDSSTASVLRLLDDGRWLVLGGSHERYLNQVIATSATSGLRRAVDTARPVLVDDYLEPDPDGVSEVDVVEVYGLRSGAVVPVVAAGRVWGAVTAHGAEPKRFGAVDVDFLHTVATVVAGTVEREEMSERVLAQATTDDLTGLPNRVVVQAQLADALADGRWDGEPVALLLLDLDDFKDVNDSLGHGAGDALLAQLGRRLDDVVGGRGTVARLGGDEFAVVLSGDAAADLARQVADDVGRSVREPFALPGIDVTLSTSIGMAIAPAHGSTSEQLLQAADMAMYRAKAERLPWAVYDAELDSRRAERLSLLSELRVALSSGQLVLHYQPLVDLASERVVEVEALVRWNHPERGLLLPGEFLPTAEQTELVHGLTRYVVRAAARQAGQWRRRGWPGTVAVNVSPLALREPGLVEQLRDELLRARGALTVELTESALLDERARDAVHTLAAAGIPCVIDDFGTGWSSLSYLRDLPVTRLKLDRAFNRDVHRQDRDAAIVGSVVQMAHALGLDVVAEGVETREVADRLRTLDVDVAQGWLYGRPQPAAALRLG